MKASGLSEQAECALRDFCVNRPCAGMQSNAIVHIERLNERILDLTDGRGVWLVDDPIGASIGPKAPSHSLQLGDRTSLAANAPDFTKCSQQDELTRR